MIDLFKRIGVYLFGPPMNAPKEDLPPQADAPKLEATTPEEEKPPSSPPYRAPPKMKDEPELTHSVVGGDRMGEEQLQKVLKRTERRARRHFDGKEVKHRVMSRGSTFIEFGYRRRSGKPVQVIWRKGQAPHVADNAAGGNL